VLSFWLDRHASTVVAILFVMDRHLSPFKFSLDSIALHELAFSLD
jgi:hypothetical protein